MAASFCMAVRDLRAEERREPGMWMLVPGGSVALSGGVAKVVRGVSGHTLLM